MSWLERITQIAEYPTRGFHAIPGKSAANPLSHFPSLHRLFNVVGMVLGFSGAKYLSDVMFAHKINGSQYTEVSREEVFPIFRPLHGIIKYNPFSDAPRDQWLKVLHQMIPAVGGAIGAVKGSEMFFVQNGGEAGYKKLLGLKTLTPLEAEQAASFAQGKIWRVGAGLSAWVSSATGLTILYGWTLNTAFMLCNRAKAFAGGAETLHMGWMRRFSNTTSQFGLGPDRAAKEVLDRAVSFIGRAKEKGLDIKEEAERFSSDVARAVFAPFFRKIDEAGIQKLAEEIKSTVKKEFDKFTEAGTLTPEQMQQKLTAFREGVTKEINGMLASTDMEKYGTDIIAGNNGFLAKIAEWLDYKGIIKASREKMTGYRPPSPSPSRA